MLSLIILSSFLLFIIGLYLIFYSPYRIRNWRGFMILFLTFTIHSIFISILPFCQLYLLYFLIFIDINSFNCFYHTIIIFYCILESLFFLFTVEEARLLNTRPLPKRPRLPNNYDEQFIDRILNVYEKSNDDIRVCFIGWFNGIENLSYDLIYEENILEYITMATYGAKNWKEITNKKQQYIKKLYKRLLKKYPEQRSKIKSGYNKKIQLKHPYRDLIQYTHYPMLKYLLFGCIRCITTSILTSMRYEYQIINNIAFYVRKYPKKTSLPPILFLHGLSLGVNTYISFIRRLTSLDRTIILLDIPSVSMRLHTEVLSMSSILSSIEQLLISLNEQYITSISHSYGTLIQSCIVKQLPHRVRDQPMIFIDPVCFLIFDSRYINNFVYRQPSTPNQLLLHTSCTKDLYSIYAIERHLCWYECNLWVEDIKQSRIRIHVFFSENDDIVPVSFIEGYLRKSNIDITIFPQFKHGQFLITPKVQDDIMETLHKLETKPMIDDDIVVHV
ncbi:unnamed protein product [Rotaria sordida]|uniref:AB hydrolase-1 domain-containing protein n=1 Tax=Rotaria sordida TaxID=392033 RepID=A0A814PZL2_9BILA|nr:unnamed protein product [Rotaria sordida]